MNSQSLFRAVKFALSALTLLFVFLPRAFGEGVLALTEIHYNPLEITPSDSDKEFLEFQNVGDESINIAGWHFTEGIDFTFPVSNLTTVHPGQYILIVKNRALFESEYGPGLPIAGQFGASLSGSGEELVLADRSGDPVIELEYLDEPPWSPLADGIGYSLVPVDPEDTDNPDEGQSWRTSANIGGSPGQEDPEPVYVGRVLVNEVLTSTGDDVSDAIELYNPTNASVDIGGWYLTDDATEQKKFRIPDGTILPPGGYLVFRESQFGLQFRLSSQGEQAYVFSADAAGNLTGYYHGFSFPGSDFSVTFGRIVNSDDNDYFPPQSEPTLGGPNSGPRVGPVVISEIMYDPPAGEVDYLEIVNISDENVALYDNRPNGNPVNGWKVEGASFIIPGQRSLAPGELALIVGGDPAAFRTRNNVPASVQVFGPFAGSLSDGGEMLMLQKPGDEVQTTDDLGNPFTVITYINVDMVEYDNNDPWPTLAAGGGFSIEREDLETFGSEPLNWRDSLEEGGSAGRNNNAYDGPTIYVNEILTHTDAPNVDTVELYNPTDAAVDIGGWYMTDNQRNPRKFQFPTGTTVPANGYLVVPGDNDGNPDNNAGLPAQYFGREFLLSEYGEELYIYSANGAGELTGYTHGTGFEALPNGVSIGRYVNSTGDESFPRQTQLTMDTQGDPDSEGRPNAGPDVGPVVISEIMYEPAADGQEYLELMNISPDNVALYDNSAGGNPYNGWRIDGINYEFPSTTSRRPVIRPQERILIVRGDPNAFRAENNVPSNIQIYGPFGPSSLNNGGERITLQRVENPDNSTGTTIIPLTHIDEVDYDNEAPWPVLNTRGRSIERVQLTLYGDEPTNWLASAQQGGTPGGGITQDQPEIISFTASETEIDAGGSVVLTFEFDRATTAAIDNDVGSVHGERTVLVSPATTTTYTLTAENRFGIAQQSVTVTVNVEGVYEDWLAQHFTAAELNDLGVSGDNADPDGDTMENLLEFAFGLDPRETDNDVLDLRVSLVDDQLTLTYTRPKDAAQVLDYIGEVNDDMDDDWQSGAAAVSETIVAETETTETVQVQDLAGTAESPRLIRVRVVRSE